MWSSPKAWSLGEKAAAGAIFAAALALRLLHLREIGLHDPFFALPAAGEGAFHQWAIEIARGNWLGEGVFTAPPLYAYFLGLLYAWFGADVGVAMLANALLGASSCVLIVAVGRRLFDGRVALLAGALFAAHSTAIFYGGMLVAANLLVPLVLLLVLASLRAAASPSPARWGLVGAAAGLCALGREILLLFAPALLVGPALCARSSAARGALGAAMLLLGVATVIVPVAWRNAAVAGEWALVDAGGGIAFYAGNRPGADGTYAIPRRYPRVIADAPVERRELFAAVAQQVGGRELRASEISSFWTRQAFAYVASRPVDWLRGAFGKLGLFFNAAELWEERSPSAERAFSWVRRMPLVGFGAIAPFALLGIGIAAREWRRFHPLYAVIAVHLVAGVAFSVLARERVVAVPALALFASCAACWLWDRARRRERRALAAGVVGLALAGCLVHLPLHRENLAMAHYRLGDRFAQLGRWDPAIEHFGRSLNRDPGAISTWSQLALAFEVRGDGSRDAVHTWLRVLDLARHNDLQLYAERAERHLRALGHEPLIAPPGTH